MHRVRAPRTLKSLLGMPRRGVRTPRKGLAKAVKFWGSGVRNGGSERVGEVAHHALEVVQHAAGKEQADGVARDEPAQRVADDAELLDVPPFALDHLQLLLDLEAHALSAALDAVVGEGAAVALGHEDVDLVARELGAEGLGDRGHVAGVAPELDGGENGSVCVLSPRKGGRGMRTPWTSTQRWSASRLPPP